MAAIVAVLGLSSSSAAGLNAEIAALGTNLLTVQNAGQSLTGRPAELPAAAPGMISRLSGVYAVQATGSTIASAYRSPLIPSVNTNALTLDAATLHLPAAAETSLAQGRFLNAATRSQPVAVLGAAAAQLLGIDHLFGGERIWVTTGTGSGMWLYIAGILKPDVLAPDIDSSILVGYPFAEKYLGFDGHPTVVYVKAREESIEDVRGYGCPRQAVPADPRTGPGEPPVRRAGRQARHPELLLGPVPRPRGRWRCWSAASAWRTRW